ncbi:MAG TPA: DUF4396 domain-containing protein [Acetobacteraceae bacterium]|nr:DUF4396 domain-containing protein [Acetobacteraceae bacterium]
MIPGWLHGLSIAALALGGVSALVIVADLRRHRQHMWIMNLVWPITALFGGAWIGLVILGRWLRAPLAADMVEFWFMMQIAMLCGFATSYSVNWWLLRSGVKEPM